MLTIRETRIIEAALRAFVSGLVIDDVLGGWLSDDGVDRDWVEESFTAFKDDLFKEFGREAIVFIDDWYARALTEEIESEEDNGMGEDDDDPTTD